VLAYRFTENRQFVANTDRNYIFLSRDPHISDQLYIMVPYMSCYNFLKNSNFRSKSIGVSLRFYQKSPVCDNNWPKLCILDWVPYQSFYGFSKSPGLRFYWKLPCSKNWPKLHISWSWPSYLGSDILNGLIYDFLRVLQKFKFLLKIHTC
jgi:hypothetical protein